MKLYSFVNAYLHHIQCGIQTAHAIVNMYENNRTEAQMASLKNWAGFHETIVVLNGGGCVNIRNNLQPCTIDPVDFLVGWFFEVEVNEDIPSAITILPVNEEIQTKIDRLRKYKGVKISEANPKYIRAQISRSEGISIKFSTESDARIAYNIIKGRTV